MATPNYISHHCPARHLLAAAVNEPVQKCLTVTAFFLFFRSYPPPPTHSSPALLLDWHTVGPCSTPLINTGFDGRFNFGVMFGALTMANF